ncbi:MAG: hypothetical protein E3J60_01190 [Dehalococcoidia bacterium]|nr:MAG: hypothetical protein E3J60_01190 [Dehalococcoidia bacterium]
MMKFPCATCEDLPTCEPALELVSWGMHFDKNGFPVTGMSVTCPKDKMTYTAKRKLATTNKEKG